MVVEFEGIKQVRDRSGFLASNLLLVETERAMMQAADTTIVVADSSKFGRSSLARLCDLSDVDTVVSDDELDSTWRQRLQSAGVELHLAQTPANQDSDTNIA